MLLSLPLHLYKFHFHWFQDRVYILLSDNIEWYGYISWEDLLAGKNNIKTLVETKFTGGGKPLDEEGNVIGE